MVNNLSIFLEWLTYLPFRILIRLMPTKQQRGFSAIIIVILLLFLGAVSLAGTYYVRRGGKIETVDLGKLRVTPDTADQYASLVNQHLPSFRKVNITVHGLSAEAADVTSYDEKGVQRKIIGKFFGETGRITREHYYHDGFLQVVFEQAEIYDQPFGEVIRTEDSWFYFENAQMVKWLFGPNKEEREKDDEFSAQEQDIVRTSGELFIALNPRLEWKVIKSASLKAFLPGKAFYNSCEAGETGHFEPEGKLPVSVPANVDSNNRVGSWRLNGETVVISGSIISDNSYSNFVFEELDGVVVAHQNTGGCGVVIGPDLKTIWRFNDTHSYTFSQEPESTAGNYTNAKWKFSLAIPEGFLVQGDDTLLHVTKKPTVDNETPLPEMSIKIGQGSKTTIENSAEIKVISQEAVSVNNVGGHKIVVSYKSYPEGNKCPIYRLHHSGVVYEFSLYECLGSDIFETVVGSFDTI